MSRIRIACLHLLGSVCLLSLSFAILYFGWYSDPGSELIDLNDLLIVILLVDVSLGPILTSVVSNTAKKPMREIARDVGVIVAIQLCAFIGAVYVLWSMRPLYYVYSYDRVEIVRAGDLDPADIEAAHGARNPLAPQWYSRPAWVWVRLPENEGEAIGLVARSLTGGKDIVLEPARFQPIAEAESEMRRYLAPISLLQPNDSEKRIERLLERSGRSADAFAFLPIQFRGRYGSLIFDRETLKPVSFVPIEFWPHKPEVKPAGQPGLFELAPLKKP